MKYVWMLLIMLFSLCIWGQEDYPFAGEEVLNGPYQYLDSNEKARGYTIQRWYGVPDAGGRALRIISPRSTITDMKAIGFDLSLADTDGDGLVELIVEAYAPDSNEGRNVNDGYMFEGMYDLHIFSLDNDELETRFSFLDHDNSVHAFDWDDNGIIEIYKSDRYWQEEYNCEGYAEVILMYSWNGEAMVLNNTSVDNPRTTESQKLENYVRDLLQQLNNGNSLAEHNPECLALELALPFLYRTNEDLLAKNALDLIYRITPEENHAFASVDAFWEDVQQTAQQNPSYQQILASHPTP